MHSIVIEVLHGMASDPKQYPSPRHEDVVGRADGIREMHPWCSCTATSLALTPGSMMRILSAMVFQATWNSFMNSLHPQWEGIHRSQGFGEPL